MQNGSEIIDILLQFMQEPERQQNADGPHATPKAGGAVAELDLERKKLELLGGFIELMQAFRRYGGAIGMRNGTRAKFKENAEYRYILLGLRRPDEDTKFEDPWVFEEEELFDALGMKK